MSEHPKQKPENKTIMISVDVVLLALVWELADVALDGRNDTVLFIKKLYYAALGWVSETF